jgi:CheY-like chemotaxis protein
MPMDATLLLTAGSFVASMVLNKAAEAVIDEAGRRLVEYVRSLVANSREAQGGVSIVADIEPGPALLRDAEAVYAASPVMRRYQMVSQVLQGARILWVDDRPDNNLFERATFTSMGATISLATSTDEAVAMLQAEPADVLISDMERYGNAEAGLQLLKSIQGLPERPDMIFYVGSLDRARGTPPGAFGITDRPDELIHLVLDVLERVRV